MTSNLIAMASNLIANIESKSLYVFGPLGVDPCLKLSGIVWPLLLKFTLHLLASQSTAVRQYGRQEKERSTVKAPKTVGHGWLLSASVDFYDFQVFHRQNQKRVNPGVSRTGLPVISKRGPGQHENRSADR